MLVDVEKKADVIVANILADIIIEMLPDAWRLLKKRWHTDCVRDYRGKKTKCAGGNAGTRICFRPNFSAKRLVCFNI